MQTHYTVTAKGNLLLELPVGAKTLNLQPGAKIEIIVETETVPSQEKRKSIRGKYAGSLSVDEFLRRKQEDIDWEDRRYNK